MNIVRQHPELTVERLDQMAPGQTISRGFVQDHDMACNITGENTGKILKWIAVRGDIHDWAIYCESPYNPYSRFGEVRDYGDKIRDRAIIKKLQPCTDEALKLYRD